MSDTTTEMQTRISAGRQILGALAVVTPPTSMLASAVYAFTQSNAVAGPLATTLSIASLLPGSAVAYWAFGKYDTFKESVNAVFGGVESKPNKVLLGFAAGVGLVMSGSISLDSYLTAQESERREAVAAKVAAETARISKLPVLSPDQKIITVRSAEETYCGDQQGIVAVKHKGREMQLTCGM